MIRRDDEQATAGGMALGRATDGVASIGLVAVVLLTLALWSSPAMAHVSSDPAAASGTTDDAGITTVVLSFDHGIFSPLLAAGT